MVLTLIGASLRQLEKYVLAGHIAHVNAMAHAALAFSDFDGPRRWNRRKGRGKCRG